MNLTKNDVKKIETALKTMYTKDNKYFSGLQSIAFSGDDAKITNLNVEIKIKNLYEMTKAPFLLPFEDFKKICKFKSDVEIQVISDNELSVSCAGVNWKVSTPEFGVFPVFSEVESIFSADLTPEHVKAIINASEFASDDDSRRALHGVVIDGDFIAGTDGKRLYRYRHGIDGIPQTYKDDYYEQFGSIINIEGGDEKFPKLFEKTGCAWTLGFSVGENKEMLNVFTGTDYIVTVRAVEGAYPNYRQLFAENRTACKVPADFYDNGKKLLQVFPRVSCDTEFDNLKGVPESENCITFVKKTFLKCFQFGFTHAEYRVIDTPRIQYYVYLLHSDDSKTEVLTTTTTIRKQVVL